MRPVKRDNRRNIDYYTIVMKASRVPILPDGPKTYIFGYNGITPGPTIIESADGARSCGTSTVSPGRTRTSATSARPPCTCTARTRAPEYDGWANDVTRPGFYKDYHYPDDQDARPLWYHDHAVHHTAAERLHGLRGHLLHP